MGKHIAFLMWGLCLFGFGIVLTVKSNLGTAPWDVLHLGLTNYLPLTLGQVSQGCGALVIALSWFLGVKPGWGSIANMIFIGFYIDFFMWLPFMPSPTSLPAQLFMLLLGIWIIGWASYFYLTAAFGAGPRDSFMVGAVAKTGQQVWLIRTLLESSVAIGGYFLGGPIGLGTIIIALTLGPSIQWAFRLRNERPEDIQHRSFFKDSVKPLAKASNE